MDTITSKNAAENCSARPHQEVAVNKEVQEQGGKRVARVAVVPHQDLDLCDRKGRGHLSKREFSRNPQWQGQRMKPLRRVLLRFIARTRGGPSSAATRNSVQQIRGC